MPDTDGVINDAVKAMMQRLLQSAAESFELAVARFDANERQAALAHARVLKDSQDPAERLLGERLEAEVLRAPINATAVVLEAPQGSGEITHPLSLASSPVLPAAATSSAAPGDGEPKKRGRGRPRKEEQPPPEPEKRGPGRPPKA